MAWIWRLIWMFWLEQESRRALKRAKGRGLLLYLKTLNVSRQALVIVLLATVCLHLFLICFVGALVTGVLLFKADSQAALQILFGAFTAVTVLGLLSATYLLSQRLWYRLSGAKRLMDDLKKDVA